MMQTVSEVELGLERLKILHLLKIHCVKLGKVVKHKIGCHSASQKVKGIVKTLRRGNE